MAGLATTTSTSRAGGSRAGLDAIASSRRAATAPLHAPRYCELLAVLWRSSGARHCAEIVLWGQPPPDSVNLLEGLPLRRTVALRFAASTRRGELTSRRARIRVARDGVRQSIALPVAERPARRLRRAGWYVVRVEAFEPAAVRVKTGAGAR